MKRAALIVVGLTLAAASRYETEAPQTEAFLQPLAGLEAAQSAAFRRGSGLFRQAWLIGPSEDHPDLVGLGPLYNRLSCIACHVKNGRGAAPDAENGLARHMVARLSVEGSDAHGGPLTALSSIPKASPASPAKAKRRSPMKMRRSFSATASGSCCAGRSWPFVISLTARSGPM
ncbi:di-heme oxidoredictase family protein [Methylocystis sp. JAN1]|uniref:di-heme oxidoredictase family protein n=1 Tax=Methylocystis sp. JAN1 TaxID=3397211 RepID=UPI003FA2D436